MGYTSKTIFKGFNKHNGMRNYKLFVAVFLCITLASTVFISINVNDLRIKQIKVEKELLEKKIDSFEIILTDNDLAIKYLKEERKPIENRISKRDGTLVKLKEQKNENFKVIFNDSADVDLRELDTLLTELIREYKIH